MLLKINFLFSRKKKLTRPKDALKRVAYTTKLITLKHLYSKKLLYIRFDPVFAKVVSRKVLTKRKIGDIRRIDYSCLVLPQLTAKSRTRILVIDYRVTNYGWIYPKLALHTCRSLRLKRIKVKGRYYCWSTAYRLLKQYKAQTKFTKRKNSNTYKKYLYLNVNLVSLRIYVKLIETNIANDYYTILFFFNKILRLLKKEGVVFSYLIILDYSELYKKLFKNDLISRDIESIIAEYSNDNLVLCRKVLILKLTNIQLFQCYLASQRFLCLLRSKENLRMIEQQKKLEFNQWKRWFIKINAKLCKILQVRTERLRGHSVNCKFRRSRPNIFFSKWDSRLYRIIIRVLVKVFCSFIHSKYFWLLFFFKIRDFMFFRISVIISLITMLSDKYQDRVWFKVLFIIFYSSLVFGLIYFSLCIYNIYL